MKKLISLLALCFSFFIASAQYTPIIANYTISGKPIGYSQATPADGRQMVYDATNFLYRAYRDSQEVITYLNLAKYRAGNVVYVVDSGGTLNGNGTYTNPHNTFWMFRDGVADVNLVKLNWDGSSSGGCPACFFTSTQLTDTSFTLNRPNTLKDTFVFDLNSIFNITTLDNGLTLTGTNGRLGGPLVVNTVINGGAKFLAISGNSFQEGEGATISTAAVLTPGLDGNTFQVIGSSAINDISITNIQGGTHVGFIFTGTPTLSNNVAGPAGSAPMLLAGSVNYTAATGDYIEFVYDGINNVWHETARKLSGSGGVYTFSSGLTELPATQVKLGGTLTQPTTIAGNGFPTFFSGGRLEPGMGIPILAAGDLVTGNDGILFHVVGTTQINAINNQNWQAGSEIGFIFDNIVTLKNNTVGGVNTSPMLLAGRVDYTSAVGDYIGFKYDGVNFYESERKLAGATSGVTANNGLTATTGNIQLGGSPLIQNTTIHGGSGAFSLAIDSLSSLRLDANNVSSGFLARVFASAGASSASSFLRVSNVTYNAVIEASGVSTSDGTVFMLLGKGSGGLWQPQVFLNTQDSSTTIFGNKILLTQDTAQATSQLLISRLRRTLDTGTYKIMVYDPVGLQVKYLPVNSLIDGSAHITTQSGGTYSIGATDYTVVATGTTSTWTFPTPVVGQIFNLVNHGSGSITLSTPVTTANGTTSSTIAAGTNYQVQWDGSTYRKIN